MSVTTEIQRINGGKQAIRTLASKKNVNIPSTALIDSYASILGTQWPDCTFNVNYDGDKIRGKTMRWNQLLTSFFYFYSSEVSSYKDDSGYITITRVTSGTNRGDFIGQGSSGVEAVLGHKYLFALLDTTANIISGRVPFFIRVTYQNNDVHDAVVNTSDKDNIHIFTCTNALESGDIFLLRYSGEAGSFVKAKFRLIDLTKNALDDITSTSDPRVPLLIQYAKDHPDYEVGSLFYSFYKGTKLGEYDYIDTTNNKLVLGGAEIDISQMSLTRFLFGSNYLFYGTNNDQETNTTNVISADYQTAANITDIPDMSVTGNGGTGKTLWFRDDSCTTVEQFKTKNAGKKVYFKLATPTEIDL